MYVAEGGANITWIELTREGASLRVGVGPAPLRSRPGLAVYQRRGSELYAGTLAIDAIANGRASHSIALVWVRGRESGAWHDATVQRVPISRAEMLKLYEALGAVAEAHPHIKLAIARERLFGAKRAVHEAKMRADAVLKFGSCLPAAIDVFAALDDLRVAETRERDALAFLSSVESELEALDEALDEARDEASDEASARAADAGAPIALSPAVCGFLERAAAVDDEEAGGVKQ